METVNGAQYVSQENVYKAPLVKLSHFGGDKDEFANRCPESNYNLRQNDDGDEARDRTDNGKRNQDSNEVKSMDSDKGYNVRENGLADSKEKEKDKATNYATPKGFISTHEKITFGEADLKNELSYHPVISADSCKGLKHDKADNQCSDAADSLTFSDKKLAGEIKEHKNKGKEKMSDGETDIPEEDEETRCGLGKFRPKWLQKWATAKSYLVLYSVAGMFQGSYFTYLIATLSTLEKRFAFKSKISGVIMTIDEIVPLGLGIFIGYFGGKAHRPRLVAAGLLLTAVCCLLSATPFFIYGPGQHLIYSNTTGPEVCNFQQQTEQCDEDDRPPTLAAVVFLIFGSFCKGFGNLAYHAIGLSYMDDNTKKKNTPVYFGIMYALRLLGPNFGYLMSSAFLKIYENPFKDPGFGNEDPRWIGAWWIGFVLQGVMLIIFGIPIMMFPRRLPSQKKVDPRLQLKFEHEGIFQKIKGLSVGLKRLSTNEPYILIALGTITGILSGFGFGMMLIRYMENQFKLSASDSSLYAGPPGLTALQVSTILGSIIIWKCRLNARGVLMGRTISEIINAIFYLLIMIPSCPNIRLGGASSVTMHATGVELVNECNKDCLCNTNVYTPLCGPDGVSTYFSACHAGCSVALGEDTHGSQVFGNCSCVLGGNGSFVSVEKMVKGYCPDEECWTQGRIYIAVLPIMTSMSSFFTVGHAMILLRSVDPQDKSFALGTFETFLSLFALIPGPVIFGALADSACLVWEFSCGVIGNCWVYDMQKFKFLLHGACASLCIATGLCNMRILFLSHKIRDLYKEEEEEDGNVEKQEKSGEKLLCNRALKNKDQDDVDCTTL